MSWDKEIEELRRREALALQMGGADKVARQHEFGKLTIRERIAAIMSRLRASSTYAADLEGVTDESRKPRAEFLERVLEVLDERDGGPEGWLQARGFDPARLRERLAA